MHEADRRGARAALSTVLARAAGFLALWCVLIGLSPLDLAVGMAAAAAATWASIELWPADGRLSLPGLLRFLPRFLLQSVVAGVDVARRAFAPVPLLQPGFASCRPSLPAGMTRGALCAVMSTQPGKLPVATAADGTIILHCLDMREPVARQLAEDETAFLAMIEEEPRHG